MTRKLATLFLRDIFVYHLFILSPMIQEEIHTADTPVVGQLYYSRRKNNYARVLSVYDRCKECNLRPQKDTVPRNPLRWKKGYCTCYNLFPYIMTGRHEVRVHLKMSWKREDKTMAPETWWMHKWFALEETNELEMSILDVEGWDTSEYKRVYH